MKKPSLYFDTSIISTYWYEGADVAMLARRLHTRDWWDEERKHFELWASLFGEAELSARVYPRQAECVKMIRRLRHLPVTTEATSLIDELVAWNYAHMANASVQERLNSLCALKGLSAPLMVSPESIPQKRLGQSIRRKR